MRKGRLLWNISVSSIGASVWSHHYYSTSKWTCTWWICIAAAAAKSLQSCPTLCDPIDGSPPGSAVPGILQARILEWVAISFSNAWKWKVKVKSLSRVRLLATPRTVAHQAPPSMGFSKQEYWSGLPLSSPTLELHIPFSSESVIWEHTTSSKVPSSPAPPFAPTKKNQPRSVQDFRTSYQFTSNTGHRGAY